MKRVGIIGGIGYKSTAYYYEQINREVNRRAGGFVSADLMLRSVNFEDYYELMRAEDWNTIAHHLCFEALDLVLKNNCDYIAIATDTMHKVAERVLGPHEIIDDAIWPPIKTLLEVPLIHIGDCIAAKCREKNAKRVLLLGSKYTMTEDFIKSRLSDFRIEAVDTSKYPNEINELNRIIFTELHHGIVRSESRRYIMEFMYRILFNSSSRPDAVILGSTSLNAILNSDNIDIPVIDSAQAHIDSIVDICLSE